MANGWSLYTVQPRSNPLHSIPQLSIPKAFRARLTGASRTVALNSSHEPPRPALQKYNAKSLDLLFVTATDSLGRNLNGQKLPLQLHLQRPKYENTPTNH